MELGMIGLGRMGSNMAQRLLLAGHRVVAYDPVPEAVRSIAAHGAAPADSLANLSSQLAAPRVVWLMTPSGDPTESTVNNLASELSAGDTIIDGGNSNYRDSTRRAERSPQLCAYRSPTPECMDDEERRDEAIWRATVLGPLVSARLEHGDVRRLCEEAAARVLERLDGRADEVSWRTIESWYYAHKAHGLDGLMPKGRSDRGQSRAIVHGLWSRRYWRCASGLLCVMLHALFSAAMPIETAPHRPTKAEHEAGLSLKLKGDEAHVELTMQLIEMGLKQILTFKVG